MVEVSLLIRGTVASAYRTPLGNTLLREDDIPINEKVHWGPVTVGEHVSN